MQKCVEVLDSKGNVIRVDVVDESPKKKKKSDETAPGQDPS